ncbi:MAG: hypothetical protein QM635_07135, partial [Microbacteriaceae bacterium]
AAAAGVGGVDHAAVITARLRSAQPGHWLERQLELAVRSRLSVAVSVRMPDGVVQEYTIEPTGIAGGRLRARDRQADLERTLPLARIEAVREL